MSLLPDIHRRGFAFFKYTILRTICFGEYVQLYHKQFKIVLLEHV